jgi:hypothetical protein
MSVESLARCALASPDLQWGIQPIVWERWAKGSGCQTGMIGGLLVYKHLNSTMDHVRNICRIGEAVSTRMLNQLKFQYKGSIASTTLFLPLGGQRNLLLEPQRLYADWPAEGRPARAQRRPDG